MSTGPQTDDPTAVPNDDQIEAGIIAELDAAAASDPVPDAVEPQPEPSPEPPAETPPAPAADDTPPDVSVPETPADPATPAPADESPPASPAPLATSLDEHFGTRYAAGAVSDSEALGAMARDAAVGRQVAQYGTAFQEFVDSQATAEAAKPPAAPAPPPPLPDLPHFDPAWVVADPDNGQPVAAPGAPPDAIQRYHADRRILNERISLMARHGPQAYSGIAEFKQESAAETKVNSEDAATKQWIDENKSELFAENGSLTQLGARVKVRINDFADENQSFGHLGPVRAYGAALLAARNDLNAMAPAAASLSPKAARPAPPSAVAQPEPAAPPPPTDLGIFDGVMKNLNPETDADDFVAAIEAELAKAGQPALGDET